MHTFRPVNNDNNNNNWVWSGIECSRASTAWPCLVYRPKDNLIDLDAPTSMSGAQTSSSSGPLSSMSPAVAESSHLGGGHGTQYDLDSSRHLSPPLDQQATDLHLSPYSVSSSAMASPLLNSPSQSAFLRTAETLEGLARQLGDLKDAEESAEGEWRCCCGSVSGCRTAEAQERNEHKMKLSGGER